MTAAAGARPLDQARAAFAHLQSHVAGLVESAAPPLLREVLELHFARVARALSAGRYPPVVLLPTALGEALTGEPFQPQLTAVGAAMWAATLGYDLIDDAADHEVAAAIAARFGAAAEGVAATAAMALFDAAPPLLLRAGGIDDATVGAALVAFATRAWSTIGGQVEDLAASSRAAGSAHWARVVAAKTGVARGGMDMATVVARKLGWLEPRQVPPLAAFAEALGAAVQHQSDLDELFGQAQSADLTNGKRVYAVARALERAPERARRRLELLLERARMPALHAAVLPSIRAEVRAHGGMMAAALLVARLTAEARLALRQAGLGSPAPLEALLAPVDVLAQLGARPAASTPPSPPAAVVATPNVPSVFGSEGYWLGRAHDVLAQLRGALEARGYALDPDLAVVTDARTPYCYYDHERRVVSLGYPDLTTASGRFRALTFVAMFGDPTVEQAARSADALLPLLTVHEAAHHLRHRYGVLSTSEAWVEEHATNILAVSYLRTRPGWSDEEPRVLEVLRRARRGLERSVEVDYVDATHDDLDEVLVHAMHAVPEHVYERAWQVALRERRPVVDTMLELGMVSAEQVAEAKRLQRAARARFDREYGSDPALTALLAMAQLAVELVDRDLPPFDEALHRYVDRGEAPGPPRSLVPLPREPEKKR
ncbi:MAG: hypothetical protein HY908_21590 [Myxococcales bacterium]|nr:hypothetical protein [Myxococcales bacterium]